VNPPPSAGPLPPYRRIAEKLKQSILRGDYAPGDRLPSVRDLAVAEGVNPNTVQSVYRLLETEGWIDRQQGAGTFVKSANPFTASQCRSQVRSLLTTARTEARRLGVSEDAWRSLEAELRLRFPLAAEKMKRHA